MMKMYIKGFCVIMLLSSCSVYHQDLSFNQCSSTEDRNIHYSKASAIELALQDLVKVGIPGVAISIYSNEGWWSSAAGFAKIEDKTLMQTCHLLYLQSISKTYMAVGILKLYEQGKIDLNAPMTKYLPEKHSRYISNPEQITVRMLLNHTSGVPEYNSVPAYVTKLLQQPDYPFSAEEYLKYIAGKPLDFTPGSRYSYRNTNYVILALMADAITGDHAKFLTEVIFKPLDLKDTFYRNEPGYLTYPNVVNAYWDRNSNSILENASQLQRNNVAALIGDDGIVATPTDAVKFLKGLMEGILLSMATLDLMKTWTKDKNGNNTYGLGLDFATIGGQTAYGHSGGGIGAGCQLYCFPEKNIYFFAGINLGTVTESPIHAQATAALEKIYQAILE